VLHVLAASPNQIVAAIVRNHVAPIAYSNAACADKHDCTLGKFGSELAMKMEMDPKTSPCKSYSA
jgi:hypothetical protein